MAMFLSTREKEIIEMLIKYHGQYVTIYDIAQHLAVSSRTIHRELKSIESFLSTFDIDLERVTKKGIQLKTTELELNSLKHALLNENTIDLSQEEQKVIILYALIQTNAPIKQYVLAQEIGVSNQTMTKLPAIASTSKVFFHVLSSRFCWAMTARSASSSP